MSAISETVDNIKSAVRDGRVPAPADLAALADSRDGALLRQAGRALAKLTEADGLRPVRVGLLATATPGPLEQLVRATVVAGGMLPTFTAADYGAFDLTLTDADNPLFGAEQDVVFCLLDDSYFLPKDWGGADVDALTEFVTERATALCGLLSAVAERNGTTLLLHTVPAPTEVLDTIVSWRQRAAFARCWAKLNAALLELPEANPTIAVADFTSALAEAAVAARDDRLRRYADLPYTDDALVLLATEVRRFLQAKSGLSRKVLALDLDNTLWGGVLGEVGAEGVELGGLYPGKCYKELQRTALRLRDQGVILVLASKNDAEHVDAALRDHPEMLLRPDVFSATAVNWSPKAGNLRQMAGELDLSVGSFVFLDDSQFERGHVADELPEVTVLPADGDPAYLTRTLVRGGWFDTLDLTETDKKRPGLYKVRAERSQFAGGFGSSEDYLAALDITLSVARATPFEVPRIAQLAARTNQFNLTGVRFSQNETAQLAEDPAHLVFSWSVKDRFGDEGVVGAAWVAADGDTWRALNFVMSCRVLGRGIELGVLGWLARQAKAAGASALEGRFVPSARNSVAAQLWSKAGFDLTEEGADGKIFTLHLDNVEDLVPAWVRVEER
ncbi:HAD-IIIC family phosphatase [Solihabitans fulvus]|uniref:HAD-IIIC family phosphatase n=1 Tax=Solihabitans fulvus TaxID=1892852 RepID=A0A5B2X1K4_9PSEU|nr:HAD-IIIC family phosphatase [Solihabitans fulvus]KAA2257090.1 HAD-IIIC family phosphatase [Solihabitans fulvus]